VGQGKAVYVGTHAQEQFYDTLYSWLLPASGLQELLPVPDGIEVCTRSGDKGDVLFILNFNDEKRKLSLPGDYQDLLTGKSVSKELDIAPYGVAVLSARA
jgi:beta-galactosidase